ncbi:MAG: hypothetical protein ACRD15_05670 [Vicinamibacterales bacterium]
MMDSPELTVGEFIHEIHRLREQHAKELAKRTDSLRDAFAVAAMNALLSQQCIGNQGQQCGMYDPNDPEQARTLAYLAFQAADAMLQERERER